MSCPSFVHRLYPPPLCQCCRSIYGKADTCSPRHGKTSFAIRSGYNVLWFEVSEISDVLEVKGFCDSDWGASEDMRSITGYGFQLCSNDPLISWKSRKQQTVALSTCEVEYMALAAATQEVTFLRQLFADICNVVTLLNVYVYM